MERAKGAGEERARLVWECDVEAGSGATSGFECFFEEVATCRVSDSSNVVEFTPGSDPFSEAERFWIPSAYR